MSLVKTRICTHASVPYDVSLGRVSQHSEFAANSLYEPLVKYGLFGLHTVNTELWY